jgi:hypothetical protein
MNHMTRHDHQQMTGPQTGHNMADIRASQDHHAGHSVGDNPWRDTLDSDYDMRGLWRAMQSGKEGWA